MTYLPILTYHRLLDESPTQDLDPKRISVSQAQFRDHLRWLKRLGYRSISLPDYPRWLRGNRKPPARSFAITFDDGYEEVLTLGLPVLQETGFTATIFAVPGQIGGANAWDDGKSRLLSQPQLRQWQQAGMTLGAHTNQHVHLTQVSPAVARAEISQSKAELEEALGSAVTLFAYPYGEYNDSVERLAQEAGFEAAFATDRAPRDHAAHLYRLRRVVVFPRTTPWEILWKVQRWYPSYQDWKRKPPDRGG